MSTALEIYAEAIDLQGRGRLDEAERRYRDLVDHHAGDPESRYARVQLEEIETRRKAFAAAPAPAPGSPATAAPAPIQILVSPQQAAPAEEARRPAVPAGDLQGRPVSAYPLDFVPAFSILGVVGFSLAVLLTVAVIGLGVMVRSQGRAVLFQSEMIKAHAALQKGDDVAFLRSIADAKSYGLRDNAPNLLVAEFFLKKKDFDAVNRELRNCPVFDEEVKIFIDRVNRARKGGKDG